MENIQEKQALTTYSPNFELTENISQNFATFSQLTQTQIAVIIEMSKNVVSDQRLTDEQLASKLNISRQTVYLCRQNQHFCQALAVIIRETVKGNTDRIVSNIVDASKKDWRAGKFLMEYTGQYTQRLQTQNLNVSVSLDSELPGDAVDTLIVRLGALGISLDRITERYIELKNQGAF